MFGKRRRSKYAAQRIELDGHTFASKKEATRYQQLKLLESAGTVRDIRLQVEIRCEVNGVLVCRYICDFVYLLVSANEDVFEDTKGFKTDVYKLKKKLVAACTGIEIKEV